MTDDQKPSAKLYEFPLRGKFAEQVAPKEEAIVPIHTYFNELMKADALMCLEDFKGNLRHLLASMNSEFSLMKQNGAIKKDIVINHSEFGFSQPLYLETWQAIAASYLEELRTTAPKRYARYQRMAQSSVDPESTLMACVGLAWVGANTGTHKIINKLKTELPNLQICPYTSVEDTPERKLITPSIMLGPPIGRPRDVREDIRACLDRDTGKKTDFCPN